MTMRIIFVNTLLLAILFLGGCSSKSKTYYEEHYFIYRDAFFELNKQLLKIRGVSKIKNDGSIAYKKSAPMLSYDKVEQLSKELKKLKVDNVKISNNLFGDSGYHLEYEVGRSGFINPRIFYLVFNSKKEDIEKLILVGGCSKLSPIEGDWYLKELYDDGLC